MPDAQISMRDGRPRIEYDGEPQIPLMYALTDVPLGRWSWEEGPSHNIRNFASAGVNFIQVDLFFDHIWPDPDTWSIETARKQIRGVVEQVPDGTVMIRFHVNAPKWWLRSHPEEHVGYFGRTPRPEPPYGLNRLLEGDPFCPERVSFASSTWRETAKKRIRRFLRELSETKEGEAVTAVQIAEGIYGEWHYWGFIHGEADSSPVMGEYFRGWLRDRYGGNVEKLRRAWNDPDVTFEAVEIPGMDHRRTVLGGYFRDPARERNLIDYYRCQHELTADLLIDYGRTVKEAWPREILTGGFYGYFFLGFGHMTQGMDLEVIRVLDSPYIDFFCGPSVDVPVGRNPGEPYRSRGLVTSVRLHGKLWLDEMDKAPKPAHPFRQEPEEYWKTVSVNVSKLRQHTLYAPTHGGGLWYYDFGAGNVGEGGPPGAILTRGWWDNPVYLRDIDAMRALIEERSKTPYRSNADVLIVYDTEAHYYLASLRNAEPVTPAILDWTAISLWSSGRIPDLIHLLDLERVDLSQYRSVVFANTFKLTAAQRRWVRDVLYSEEPQPTGEAAVREVVWIAAPGYTDGERLSIDFVREATGLVIRPAGVSGVPAVALSNGSVYTLGTAPIRPLFTIDEPGADVRGRFTENNAVATAWVRAGRIRSGFIALPSKGYQGYRVLFDDLSAHKYGEGIFYSGSGMLVWHTGVGGRQTAVLKNGTEITVEFPYEPSTAVLDPESGELLLSPALARNHLGPGAHAR